MPKSMTDTAHVSERRLKAVTLLSFPSAYLVKIADCKERGGADMHAWVSRSSTTAWHGSRADGHGLKAQESILQLHEPSASEGVLSTRDMASSDTSLSLARSTWPPVPAAPTRGPAIDLQLTSFPAWPHYKHIEGAYTLLCAMATQQTPDRQQQHATAIMIAKQASAMEQKLLLLVDHSNTGCTILPNKAHELAKMMTCTLPWTLRLIFLRLICVLPEKHKLELLTDSQCKGLNCLREWLVAACNIGDEAKREAVLLTLLQTFAVLADAKPSLVQPWMLDAADKLILTCPLRTVSLAAVELRQLCKLKAPSIDGGKCSDYDSKGLGHETQHCAESHASPQVQHVLAVQQPTVADWAMQQFQRNKRHVENRTAMVTDSNTAAALAAAKTREPAAKASNAASSSAAFWPASRHESVKDAQADAAAVEPAAVIAKGAPKVTVDGHWTCNDQDQAVFCSDAVLQPAKRQKLDTMTVPQVSSRYWSSVIATRQAQLGLRQHQGVQLVQSAVGPHFWELSQAALRPIGSGGICLGAVEYIEHMLEDGTMQACALKRLRFSTEKEQAMAKGEMAALQAVQGVAHIAQLVYAGPYPQPAPNCCSWGLVMRFVPGNVMKAVYELMWRNVWQPHGAERILRVTQRLFPQICQAVKALHNRKMSHTDLKPSNIIISLTSAGLSGLQATVTDLGGAVVGNRWPEPGIGIHHSVEYCSPELLSKLRSEATNAHIDFCAHDIWSLGCLLAWALTGINLFSCKAEEQRELGYSFRLGHVCSMQKPWVGSFYEGYPELCLADDDDAVDSIPYTNHVYTRLAQTICDDDLRMLAFQLLRSMLHPNPLLRASINDVLASPLFQSC